MILISPVVTCSTKDWWMQCRVWEKNKKNNDKLKFLSIGLQSNILQWKLILKVKPFFQSTLPLTLTSSAIIFTVISISETLYPPNLTLVLRQSIKIKMAKMKGTKIKSLNQLQANSKIGDQQKNFFNLCRCLNFEKSQRACKDWGQGPKSRETKLSIFLNLQ